MVDLQGERLGRGRSMVLALLVVLGVLPLGSSIPSGFAAPGPRSASAQSSPGWMTPEQSALFTNDWPALVPSYVPEPFASVAPQISIDGSSYQLYWAVFGGSPTFLEVRGYLNGYIPAGSAYDLNVELTLNSSVRGAEAYHDPTPIYDAVYWREGGISYWANSQGLSTDIVSFANSFTTASAPAPEPTATVAAPGTLYSPDSISSGGIGTVTASGGGSTATLVADGGVFSDTGTATYPGAGDAAVTWVAPDVTVDTVVTFSLLDADGTILVSTPTLVTAAEAPAVESTVPAPTATTAAAPSTSAPTISTTATVVPATTTAPDNATVVPPATTGTIVPTATATVPGTSPGDGIDPGQGGAPSPTARSGDGTDLGDVATVPAGAAYPLIPTSAPLPNAPPTSVPPAGGTTTVPGQTAPPVATTTTVTATEATTSTRVSPTAASTGAPGTTPSAVPPTATRGQATATQVSTATAAPTEAVRTAGPSTATTVPGTTTAVPPITTAVAPTVTVIPATAAPTTIPTTAPTLARPTATSIPPTVTISVPTATSSPVTTVTTTPSTPVLTPPTPTPSPTSTLRATVETLRIQPTLPPAVTTAPPTATAGPPTATVMPSTATSIPPTPTTIPPTASALPPTATAVPPTATATATRRPPATATPTPVRMAQEPRVAGALSASPVATTAPPAGPTVPPASPTAQRPTPTPTPPPTMEAIQQEIGPEGGTLRHPAGADLEIGGGVFDATMIVSMVQVPDGQLPVSPDVDLVPSTAFDIELTASDGTTTTNLPAGVTLRLALPDKVRVDAVVYWIDGQDLRQLGVTNQEDAGISAPLAHLSRYVAGVPIDDNPELGWLPWIVAVAAAVSGLLIAGLLAHHARRQRRLQVRAGRG